MKIIADTHVHVYPCHTLAAGLSALVENLGRLAPGALRVACFAERHDCHGFRDLAVRGRADLGEGLVMEPGSEENSLRLLREGSPVLVLFAGRQIVTAERLEVLALTVDSDIPDGLPAATAVERVASEQGIPVLAWAPGKWFSDRGQIVRDLIDASAPGRLLIGDSTLRPTCWAEPLLMRRARRKGLNVVAGSDPLPFPGEESVMGTYGCLLDGDFSLDRPVTSLRRLLTGGAAPVLTGRRGGVLSTVIRLGKHARNKHGHGG